jgi:energy-coupling factor transporter ATP-binding protein EcfA2
MHPLLDRELIFITGKGGVGKTTMAAAIGLAAAETGRRVIVAEVGEQSRVPAMFGRHGSSAGSEIELEGGLSGITIDPDRALLEWLQSVGGRVSGRLLASSGTFQYFAAAAPGAQELVSMVKIWQLTRSARERRRRHDLVVVDAPSTGHALGMLGSPQTFGAIARVGPIAGQTQQVRDLLCDPARTAYLAVALGTEMAVTEALEVQDGLGRQLGRGLDAVIVNGLMPRRFSASEMQSIAALGSARTRVGGGDGDAPAPPSAVRHAAAHAARAVDVRSRTQHNQMARLRRREFQVLGVPFHWGPRLDLRALRGIAEGLSRKLQHAGAGEEL